MIMIVATLVFIAGIVVMVKAPSIRLQGGRSPRSVALVMMLLGVLGILTQSIVSVPAGNVGLKDFFGKVSDTTLSPGIHLVNPLLRIRPMNVRTQEITETAVVPSKEGMNVRLDLSILFRLDSELAPSIYKTIGMDYINIFIAPQLRAKVRSATTNYEAKALYTSEREAIAMSIHSELSKPFADRGIYLERVLLRSITLPDQLAKAIEAKLQSEQEAERMKFVLQREEQEALRKEIEAKGIREFQKIVSQGIDDNLLRWKGIEATEKLAGSANSKVVIVGGQDGMPLIFNAGN